ncbi:hypothetical protein SAMN04488535_2037 [Corynebacterium mycetoides]|uniref:Uncharacterized protein n=1 Tax=Corynebacterium mycetoides TaxID=38302 RepID=A0A1G9QR19_9CORY|nr:hypothetical protein SAMN04488535_2037 [Corynebacterium mycetoides]
MIGLALSSFGLYSLLTMNGVMATIPALEDFLNSIQF